MLDKYLDRVVEVFDGVDTKKAREEAMDCYILLLQIHLQSVKKIIPRSIESELLNYTPKEARARLQQQNAKEAKKNKRDFLESEAKKLGVPTEGLTEEALQQWIYRLIFKQLLKRALLVYGLPIAIAVVLIAAVVLLAAVAIKKITETDYSSIGGPQGIGAQGVEGANTWIEAVGGAGFKITGHFGESRPGHMHQGVDIAIPTGTNLHAAFSGVAYQKGGPDRASGNYIELISDDKKVRLRLMHMSNFSVQNGQHVEAGQIIGHSGSTGRSTGSHLHLEVAVLRGNEYVNVNPETFEYLYKDQLLPKAPNVKLNSTQQSRANYIVEAFKRNGYSEEVGLAFAGLVFQETSFMDSAIYDKGVAQWDHNRRPMIIAQYNRMYHKNAKSMRDIPFQDQVLMMIWDLQNNNAELIPRIRNLKDSRRLQEELFLSYSNGPGHGKRGSYEAINRDSGYRSKYLSKYGPDFAHVLFNKYFNRTQVVTIMWHNRSNVK